MGSITTFREIVHPYVLMQYAAAEKLSLATERDKIMVQSKYLNYRSELN